MYARRRHACFLMMGGGLVLSVSAWAFVRLWSIPVAVGMCVAAMVIPPIHASTVTLTIPATAGPR